MPKAGSAKSKAFNLGTAAVMIGPRDQVMDLTPQEHSVGLVKNFTISSSDSYTDLNQGVRNNIVYSVKTGSEITATMEVYEYTPKNLNYALGLESSGLIESESFSLKEDVAGGSTNLIVTANPTSGEGTLMAGEYLVLQANKSGEEAQVYPAKIKTATYVPGVNAQIASGGTVHDLLVFAAKANGGVPLLTIQEGKMKVIAGAGVAVTMSDKFKTAFTIADGTGPVTGTKVISASDKLTTVGFAANDNITIEFDGTEVLVVDLKASPVADTEAKFTVELEKPLPATMNFKMGDRAKKVNLVPVGSNEAQPMLGAKVVGILPEDNEPITLIFPKMRITEGFSIGFQTDQFSNMPFSFTPYEMDETDPLYEEHKNDGLVFLLV